MTGKCSFQVCWHEKPEFKEWLTRVPDDKREICKKNFNCKSRSDCSNKPCKREEAQTRSLVYSWIFLDFITNYFMIKFHGNWGIGIQVNTSSSQSIVYFLKNKSGIPRGMSKSFDKLFLIETFHISISDACSCSTRMTIKIVMWYFLTANTGKWSASPMLWQMTFLIRWGWFK